MLGHRMHRAPKAAAHQALASNLTLVWHIENDTKSNEAFKLVSLLKRKVARYLWPSDKV